jgi:hypothetical protein
MFPRFRVRFIIPALVAFAFVTFISLGRWGHFEVAEAMPEVLKTSIQDVTNLLKQELETLRFKEPPPKVVSDATGKLKAGVPDRPAKTYSMTVVMGKKKDDDTSWLEEDFGRTVEKAVYIVDDPTAPLQLPENKGNEAMVYLTYIIDHYDRLEDITLFMHHHRWTWHNNDLLDNDSSMVVKHILPQRVIREGYVNLRCQWSPGCPSWLKPNTEIPDPEKEEEMLVKSVWPDLFPGAPLPDNLAQPCCSQFALSRERIHAIPQTEYIRLRDWLLSTDLQNKISGRLFEYLWQYLWTGAPVLCPSQHACYCDLYGICFVDEAAFQKWFQVRFHIKEAEWAIIEWEKDEEKRQEFMLRGMVREAEKEQARMISVQEYEDMRDLLNSRWITLSDDRDMALVRGKSGKVRAKIAGRTADFGDG